MGKQGCTKIELHDAKYSSPVPVIGLYIAAASLVCFLAMSFDILSGFRHRKRWLPCRLFSLNSVTLTLLSVAAKLPVDLTTAMPSAQDQMSKLTGTTLICICMGFLMPSLGRNQNSECLTNMSALSILVVTVIVNISIQIGTGVIFMFITEHIIIMCCMLLLLIVLWALALEINSQKDVHLDSNIDHFTKGQGSLLKKLKLTYVYGYNSDPQFLLCKHMYSQLVGLICLPCLAVLIHAAVRSLTLEFCRGKSDYNWAIWIIIMSQILTIALGGFVTSFRLFALYSHSRSKSYYLDGTRQVIFSNPLLEMDPGTVFSSVPAVLLLGIADFLFLLLTLPFFALFECLHQCKLSFEHKCKDDKDTKEYVHLIHENEFRLDEWSLRKSVNEMKRWTTPLSECETLNHLSKLLSRRFDPSQQLQTMELKYQIHSTQVCLEVSFLSIALLVRIAQVCLPSGLSYSLLRSHEEAHELVRFIDKNLNSVGFRNQNRSKFAEAVWRGVIFEISELSAGRGFSSLFPKIFESANDYTTLSCLDRALVIIKKLKTAMPSDIVSDEVGVITSIIGSREYSSIEDLSIFIEQMFVDMMHMFLARFPHAVFKEVTDSPAEEFDERIGLALHFVCQLKWLKAPIRWSFPAGCDISSLVDDQVHNAQNQVDSIEEPTTVENSISLHVTENVDNAFHITVDDEIVRVE